MGVAVVVVVAVAVAVAVAAADAGVGFEVLDAFGGFARLESRSPTLDGSVSLRATQACAPLLEGNAFGQQIVLTKPLRIERVLGRWRACEDESWALLERARRAAVPMLRARGLLGADAWPQLDRGLLTSERGHVRVWTGLCVRPRPGTWLLLSSVGNRRRRSFTVQTRVVPEGWTPLWLELVPAADARAIKLQGEVACLGVIEPGLRFERCTLAERPELGHAHLAFYEQAYFEAKQRGEITRRYRKTIDAETIEHVAAPCIGELVELGPCPGAIEPLEHCLLPSGPAARVPEGLGKLERLRFDNLLEFAVDWDGHEVELHYDHAALHELATSLRGNFVRALGRELIEQHPGAIWYLSKYFTPHPVGEPHFFVKPWALTRVPSGWSLLLDGVHGPDYDVMRGVMHADQFFATPAVFQLFELGRTNVPAKRLLHATPIPRAHLHVSPIVTVLEGAPLA